MAQVIMIDLIRGNLNHHNNPRSLSYHIHYAIPRSFSLEHLSHKFLFYPRKILLSSFRENGINYILPVFSCKLVTRAEPHRVLEGKHEDGWWLLYREQY
jgi:hypothetical protein